MRIQGTVGALSLSILLVLAGIWGFGAIAQEEGSLSLSTEFKSVKRLSPLDRKGLLADIQRLLKNAGRLRKVANMKYTEASKLRSEAGGARSKAFERAQALQGRAQSSAQTSQMMGGLLSSLTGMLGGGMPGADMDTMLAGQLTQTLSSSVAQMDSAQAAQKVQKAQSTGGRLQIEAERRAGPLEMRAERLTEETNRLMEVANKYQDLANAKSILLASEELRLKAIEQSKLIQEIEARVGSIISSL